MRANILKVGVERSPGPSNPQRSAEIAKVIDAFVSAYQTAELDEREARVEQLTDTELMPIAMGGHVERMVTPLPRLLTVAPR